MGRICYFHAFSGMSGDMTVGSLFDAGADPIVITQTLESLGPGASFEFAKVKRCGIGATKFRVTGKNEEMLAILHGQGAALIEGQPKCTFTAPAVAYIPPETRHNVENNGSEPLAYVYVVAPTAGK